MSYSQGDDESEVCLELAYEEIIILLFIFIHQSIVKKQKNTATKKEAERRLHVSLAWRPVKICIGADHSHVSHMLLHVNT